MKVATFAAALLAPSLAAEGPDQPTGAGPGGTSDFNEATTAEEQWNPFGGAWNSRVNDLKGWLRRKKSTSPEVLTRNGLSGGRSYKENLLQQRLRTSQEEAAEMSETDG